MVNHNGLLQRPCLSTKGGLAVVRPRGASSIIRQTTLVSHGRAQDGVEFFFLVMAFLKKALERARHCRQPRVTAHVKSKPIGLGGSIRSVILEDFALGAFLALS